MGTAPVRREIPTRRTRKNRHCFGRFFVFIFIKRYNKLILITKLYMSSKTVYFISFAIFALGLLLGIAITYSYFTVTPSGVGHGDILPVFVPGPGDEDMVACTMDAKACPDGSYVGRVGPNCEFEACPTTTADTVSGKSCTTVSDCGTDYECVDLSPVVREGVPANLRCSKIGAPRPICLSGDTRISTLVGDILAKNMKEGMSVWTTDASGKKVSGTVLLAGKTRAPATHKVMHIKLSDGRELLVSPGHKIADGRTAGQIILGDTIDNATVILANLVPYTQEYTYDILPSGETGMYYANGILLQSTLK
jgi:hypothetical protein